MNVRKRIFAVAGSVITLLLPGVMPALSGGTPGSALPEKRKAVPARRTQQGAPGKTVTPSPKPAEPTRKETEPGAGDPFSYAGSSSGDYTPLSGHRSVGIITVKGIICMAGEEPRAILHLKDSGRVHYVSKNSVVRVSAGERKTTGPSEAYIVVKEIRNDEVELIQLERPDKVIIIR